MSATMYSNTGNTLSIDWGDSSVRPKPTECSAKAEASPPELDEKEGGEAEDTRGHLHGWRLWLVAVLISVVYFVVQVEVSIVTTSLVIITQDIGGFERAGWIMSSYLLGFVSCVVINAKLSDIIGRKVVFLSCLLIFTVFSGACAAAQTIDQLIVLRAFQGVGGGGSYALGSIMLVQTVPAKELPKMAAYSSISFIVATALGPIVGGGICQHTTWRWIFLFNVPIGVFAMSIALIGIPNGYPHHADVSKPRKSTASDIYARMDLLGGALLLVATVAFTSAFEEANSRFPWDSAFFIVLIVASLIMGGGLLLWERRLTRQDGAREPILPWRFIVRRDMLGAMLGLFLVGGPLTVTILQLPQRFQLVNRLSAINAGARLLPFGAASTVGGMVMAQVFSRFKTPLVYVIMAGAALQIIGFACLGTIPDSVKVPPRLYGFEVIAGVGGGISYLSLFAAVPLAAQKRDHAVGLGVSHQFRALGSAVTVAIATSIFNGHVFPSLRRMGILDPESYVMTGSERQPDPGMLDDVRAVLSRGYNYQMFLLCGFAAAQFLAALLMWKRKQISPV